MPSSIDMNPAHILRALLLVLFCLPTLAAEFAVRCPKCETTQRLMPTAIHVIGSCRTNDGFIDERLLKFRCDQRKCRHRFTALNSVFRKEVRATPIPPALRTGQFPAMVAGVKRKQKT